MITIDGSYGEGGGQILRTSLALSAITRTPCRIYNIRKKRKKPGLLPQHLTAVRAAKEISNAKAEGAVLYSSQLVFKPQKIEGGFYEFNVAEEKKSAGSVTLVYQTLLPIILFSDKKTKVVVKGGTHVPMSPLYEYFDMIFLKMLEKIFDIKIKRRLIKHGFYPRGGGKVEVEVEPVSKLSLKHNSFKERGKLISIDCRICISSLPEHIAEREEKVLRNCLKDMQIERTSLNFDAGNYIFLRLCFENVMAGFSSLGMRKKPAERVAEEVCESYKDYINKECFFDSHLADQILLYLALTKKELSFTTQRVTQHLLTNAWVIEKFLGVKIEIKENTVSLKHG